MVASASADAVRAEPSVDDALTRDERRALDLERAAPMRARTLAIVLLSLAVWTHQWAFYESSIFPVRAHSWIFRGVQLATCVLSSLVLVRARSPRVIEWTAVLTYASIAVSAEIATLVVAESCVVPFTLTIEWGMMVFALVSGLAFVPAGVVLATTFAAGALATTLRGTWDVDLTDHAVLLTIYVLVLLAIRSTDRLRRREVSARTRLAAAHREAVHADEVRGRLFVNLSHDFRTPLALVHAEAERLERAPSGAPQRDALARIRAHTRWLAKLTNQLLELARLDSGRTPRTPTNVDVVAIAEGVVARLAQGDETTTARVVAHGVVAAEVDRAHLQRIVANLVENALRQPSATRSVRVVCRTDDPHVLVDVEDDGPGVPAERVDEIFERFASFDATGSVASGIGLPVARELAELNGGELRLVEGAACTTFRLRLPRARGPVEAVDEPPQPSTPPPHAVGPPASLADARGRSLVVVEDHAEMRALLVDLLGERFSLRTAGDLAAARAMLELEPPSCVLSDVLLPDGRGHDLLAWMRAHRTLADVPVVFLSALGDPQERAAGVRAGADDYVAKPFSATELTARIEAACTRAEQRSRALADQRIAFVEELHDGIAASLSRAAMLLGALDGHADAPKLAAAADAAVREALGESREIMTVLEAGDRSVDAVAEGLGDELAMLAAPFDVEVTLALERVAGSPRLSAVESHTLRRVAREAVTNALRHGAGAAVRCRLVAAPHRLCFEAVGSFTPGQREASVLGRGLAIARRRVERLGGALDVRFDGPRATFSAVFPIAQRGGTSAAREQPEL